MLVESTGKIVPCAPCLRIASQLGLLCGIAAFSSVEFLPNPRLQCHLARVNMKAFPSCRIFIHVLVESTGKLVPFAPCRGIASELGLLVGIAALFVR